VSNPTTSPEAHPDRPIVAEWVKIPVSGAVTEMTTYLARPAGSGPWPAVLLGFEMFGVTGYLRRVAERLAGAGYVAMVPDFYHRYSSSDSPVQLSADAEGRSRGLELVGDLRRERVLADVQAALQHLAARQDTRGTAAMVGLSAGGHIAYYAATQVPLAALVVFYPGWSTGAEIPLSQPVATLTLTPDIRAGHPSAVPRR